MKNYKFLFTIVILSLVYFAGCSSQDTQQESGDVPNKDSVYVFDEIMIDTTSNATAKTFEDNKSAEAGEKMKSNPALVKTDKYTVQLGAFSSKARADEFYEAVKGKVNQGLNIFYSDFVKLYVVQLNWSSTKPEADKLSAKLKKLKEFKDAFVVPYYIPQK